MKVIFTGGIAGGLIMAGVAIMSGKTTTAGIMLIGAGVSVILRHFAELFSKK